MYFLISAILPGLFDNVPCAQAPTADAIPPECAVSDIFNVVSNLIRIFMTLAGILAVIFIIIGGIQYITSQGNPAGIQKAKMTLTYAIGGLALVLVSLTLVSFIGGVFS